MGIGNCLEPFASVAVFNYSFDLTIDLFYITRKNFVNLAPKVLKDGFFSKLVVENPVYIKIIAY